MVVGPAKSYRLMGDARKQTWIMPCVKGVVNLVLGDSQLKKVQTMRSFVELSLNFSWSTMAENGCSVMSFNHSCSTMDENGRSVMSINHSWSTMAENGRSVMSFYHSCSIMDENGRSVISINHSWSLMA